MGERKVDDLDGLSVDAAMAAAAERKAARPKPEPEPKREVLVDVNYPDPTSIAKVVRDVSKWSGKSFVMEPRLDAKIQIFAPERMRPGQAYDLFLASLSVLGLRAVQVNGVVKIVTVTPVVFGLTSSFTETWRSVPRPAATASYSAPSKPRRPRATASAA